jgi:SAM-dependent methyltransferase
MRARGRARRRCEAIGENPPVKGALYDRIGIAYSATRREDARLAATIWDALGDARTVINVGAGAGAYEPHDRDVVAVEPSAVTIAQRAANAAPVIQADAEALPFPDKSFDAAMAVLSDHHWRDRRQGLHELRRVARGRVVLFNANPTETSLFWLTSEYLPVFLELIPRRYRQQGGGSASLRSWSDRSGW